MKDFDLYYEDDEKLFMGFRFLWYISVCGRKYILIVHVKGAGA